MKKRMRLTKLLLLWLAVFSLSGCAAQENGGKKELTQTPGQAEQTPGNAETVEKEEEQTIADWKLHDTDSVYGTGRPVFCRDDVPDGQGRKRGGGDKPHLGGGEHALGLLL